MKRNSAAQRSNAGNDWLSNPAFYRNKRIRFEKNTITNDKYENQVQSWEFYFECWAYANTIQASESNGDIPQERIPIIFETRYCPELMEVTSTDYRVIFDGEAYDITAVDRMNFQNNTLKFSCSRVDHHLQPTGH